jgi:uroporphyrinogen-III synthase
MSGSSASSPLAGRGIVVTRPLEQAHALEQMIVAAGGRPILFPLLEILDPADPRPLHALIDRLDEFDLAIFISPTAVDRALALIRARRTWPARLAVAAVGAGSARALHRLGVSTVIAPAARFDSEGLLELPELRALSGKRVVIFRGLGGRELLRDALGARGAQVELAECYRRERPAADAQALLTAWAANALDAIALTSSEGLANLIAMLSQAGRERLNATPLFVPHPRIGESAREHGLEQVHVTASGDDGLMRGLIDYFNRVKAKP